MPRATWSSKCRTPGAEWTRRPERESSSPFSLPRVPPAARGSACRSFMGSSATTRASLRSKASPERVRACGCLSPRKSKRAAKDSSEGVGCGTGFAAKPLLAMIGADWSLRRIWGPRQRRERAENLERVLLVDDDVDLRQGLAQLLRERYEVLTASNGDEALEILGREPVDVVILDMLMPLLDGQSVLRELRAKTPPPPVVVISARPDLIA